VLLDENAKLSFMATRIAYSLVAAILLCVATSAQELLLKQAEVPHYPLVAIAARLSGTVRLHVTIKDGSVATVEPDSATPSKIRLLTEGAIYDVKTWKFAPDDNAEIDVTFTYELAKEVSRTYENPHIEMQLPRWVKLTAKPTAQE
jgi:hypothetical protein